MNAHFILRVATDRDWAADVRAQSFWLDETNRLVEMWRRFVALLTNCLGLENATTICTVERQFSLPDLMVGSQLE